MGATHMPEDSGICISPNSEAKNIAFRCQKTEKHPERVAYVYGGHLRGDEKILAFQGRSDRGRRRASSPESEER